MVSLEDVRRLVPTLDDRRFSALARHVVCVTKPEDVSLADRLLFGICEFLNATGFVSDVQTREIVPLIRPTVRMYAEEEYAGRVGLTALPVFSLVTVEQRWVSWSGRGGLWYDLRLETDVESLPEPGVLFVTCDVTAMHVRMEKWLARLKGTDAGQSAAG